MTDRPSLLCPDLVARDDEVRRLRERVESLRSGSGGVVVLVGDAGAGKTRLASVSAEAAAELSIPVLSGRAVPGPNPVPFRPLTEAFLAAFRSSLPPTSAELAGFGGHMGRLVPAWRPETPDDADDSPLLVGEAAVRLLASLGDGPGAVLVIEDLHWADAETLAVVEYLSDALRGSGTLCVCTARTPGVADGVLLDLERRDPSSVLRVTPLSDDDVDRMLAGCLAVDQPPHHVAEFARAHSDGNPFLVEELLAGLVASGGLRFEAGRWVDDGELTPTVPASFGASITQRLARLDAVSRRIVGAAALLGRHFDWELLPGIAEVDGRAVVEALRAAVDEHLVVVEGSAFSFRHALTREAVLDDLLPPDRAHLARRALPAVERANPGLPGPACELAAELAEAAGRTDVAAAHLMESARRALSGGALTTAETAARRARRLAEPSEALSLTADELLVRVLVAAGKPGDARALGHALVHRMKASPEAPERVADLLVALARAAVTGGDSASAGRDVDAARDVLGLDPDAAAAARLDAVAGLVALEQADLDTAARLAGSAASAAAASGQPAVECEALLVLGRAERVRQTVDASACFERAAQVASRHDLASWHLRAQHELALEVWPTGNVAPLRDTRDLAARYGALLTVAVMDLSLADVALSQYDRAGCAAAAAACVEASRRYGLATETVAHLWLAGAHALAGDEDAMHAEAAAALAPDPEDPRILGDLHGRVLAVRAFLSDDLAAMRAHLDTMIVHARVAPPGTSVFPGRTLWAAMHAIDDEDLGEPARAELGEVAARLAMPTFQLGHDIAEAVAVGRQGDAERATAMVARARERLRNPPLGLGTVHTLQVLVAQAAIRDGWGDPVPWLRESEAFFAAGGYGTVARRCRTLLGEAGAPIPRRGRGDSEVPPSLRALGVTSRELDVLKLVASGLTNRQVADQLFLSSKTVERHLTSLFDRSGVRDRQALADVARQHGVVVG